MQEIISQAKELAIDEINKYGVPKMEHFVLANEKGQQLAEALGTNKDIVLLGTMLMDLKIGQCMKEGRLIDHVKDSSLAAQEFLKQFDLNEEVFKKIVSCIELHHGTKNYYCLEAEICANSDCYRFLSPEGFFHGLLIFGNRLPNFNEALTNLENKVEEKYNIVSLDICRQEVEENYHIFKKLIKAARRV
jgi:hypothetical protein